MHRPIFAPLAALAVFPLVACPSKTSPPASPGGSADAAVRASAPAALGPGPAATVPRAGEPGAQQTSEEVEPNNDAKTATLLALDTSLRATIRAPEGSKTRDEDWFKVTSAEEKGVLKVEVAGVPELRLNVELQDERGARLAHAEGAKGEGVIIPNAGVKKGTYLVRVREASRGAAPVESQTPYTITASIAARADGDEAEPNNRSDDATELADGKPMRGFLAPRGDEDWWRVPLPEKLEGAYMRLSVKGVAGAKGSVGIIDPTRAKVLDVPLKEAGEVILPNVGLKDGWKHVFVVVRLAGAGNAKDPYEIVAKLEKSTGDMEVEPNNTEKQATPINVGKPMRGFIGAAKDVDIYKFTVEKPSVARVELSGIERVNLVLEVLGAKGERLARSDDGRAKEPESVANVYIPAGDAFIKVAGNTYNLDETYEVTVTTRPAPDDEEREPNNTEKQANEIEPGKTLIGYVHPKGDRDFYRVSRASEGPLKVSVTGIPKVALAVSVIDEKGARVAEARAKKEGEDISVDKVLPAGEYRVVVEQNREAAVGKKAPRVASNPKDPYRITVGGSKE